MSEKVLIDAGEIVSVHTRIKDMCKAARNKQGLSNQDICDLISERFGLEDFSIHTVTNFFSDKSKATTIYTTGYICAVLGISIDEVFNIENSITDEKEKELVQQIFDLKVEARAKDQKIEELNNTIVEKNERIKQAHEGLDFYRKEAVRNARKVQPWVFLLTLILLVCVLIFVAFYLVFFDVRNPEYGIFRSALLLTSRLTGFPC